MNCIKIDNNLLESLFSDDDLGLSDETKQKIATRDKRREAAKKASKTRAESNKINKQTSDEMIDDIMNSRQLSIKGDDFVSPINKHSAEDIQKFKDNNYKLTNDLKSTAKKRNRGLNTPIL